MCLGREISLQIPLLCCRFFEGIVANDNEHICLAPSFDAGFFEDDMGKDNEYVHVHVTPHSVIALDNLCMKRIYNRRFLGQNYVLMKTSTI